MNPLICAFLDFEDVDDLGFLYMIVSIPTVVFGMVYAFRWKLSKVMIQ